MLGQQNDTQGDDVSGVKKKVDELQYELDRLRSEEDADVDELNRIRVGISNKERESQDHEQKIKVLDYDLYRAQERLKEQENIKESKEFELKRADEALEKAKEELSKEKKKY